MSRKEANQKFDPSIMQRLPTKTGVQHPFFRNTQPMLENEDRSERKRAFNVFARKEMNAVDQRKISKNLCSTGESGLLNNSRRSTVVFCCILQRGALSVPDHVHRRQGHCWARGALQLHTRHHLHG